MNKQFCLRCGKKIKRFVNKCPYCKLDYGKPKKQKKSIFDEIVEQTVRDMDHERKINKKQKKEKKPMFSNAEALFMGIYPDDEAYKMAIMDQMYDEEE